MTAAFGDRRQSRRHVRERSLLEHQRRSADGLDPAVSLRIVADVD